MDEIQVGKEYDWFGQSVKILEIYAEDQQALVETQFGARATAEFCDLGAW